MHRQVLPARMPHHCHLDSYAAVVLGGSYEEAGEAGRFRAEAGHVLLHAPFSAHQDHSKGSAIVLNLALPLDFTARSSCKVLGDIDRLVRLAERRLEDAVAFLHEATTDGPTSLLDVPDELARFLSNDDPRRVTAWARERGVCRETAFRWFTQAYGIAPTRYRVEARARRAWQRIVGGDEPLAAIAIASGFSDQAHLTREVRRMTGRTPGQWRRFMLQHSFKMPAPAAR